MIIDKVNRQPVGSLAEADVRFYVPKIWTLPLIHTPVFWMALVPVTVPPQCNKNKKELKKFHWETKLDIITLSCVNLQAKSS